jgi:hypothetical protein
MANLGFDCTALAKAVIDAADGDVVQFSRRDPRSLSGECRR